MVGSMDKGTLHFALLGPPQVYHGGQLLTFPSRKTFALLLYLAVEEGKHSRKMLSELFWPESDAAHARSALRTTVHELRDVLMKNAVPAQRTEADRIPHLYIDRDTLSLDVTSGVSLDLHTLQAAWVLAHDTARVTATLPEEIHRAHLAQLQEATMLSRGEFLEGFSLHNAQGFDDWTRFQREYWHLHMQLVFDRLSSLYENAGEFEQAIAVIIRWLALTFLNEEASQRLMRLHFATGNRVAALQAYEAFRALLASEIHVEPTPETMALAERIRATAPAHHTQQQHVSAISSPLLILFTAPFVGRTREYGLLLEHYYLARLGQIQVVLLEGEAGIGKTRLATEFLDWATALGTDVLRGQGFESTRRLSYQPFIEALRPRIDQENAPEDLLHDVWLAELARLLPELYERYPDLTRMVADASVARNHLFEAVTRLLVALAARTPLLLFLDDVHWADTGTLDLLHYLARHFTTHATPIMLLLSLRTEARQTSVSLAEWRANLGRIVPLTRLPLGPLSAQDTVNLLQILAQRNQAGEANQAKIASLATKMPVDFLERVGQRLFAETGGQPFYLIETLKHLLTHGLLTPSSSSSEDSTRTDDIVAVMSKENSLVRLFPPSVRELVSIQLDRLSPSAFAFLVAGAVLEQDATFERLCLVADLSEHEGLVALDEVLRSLLVQEPKWSGTTRGNDVYTFAHPMIGEVVYVEAGETRSRIFHRRALHLLQDASIPAAKLAHHALAAGMLDPAFHLSVVAGDEARAVFALDVAIEHYEQAWQLLTKQRNDHPLPATTAASDVHHLYVSLGQACELTRAWEQADPLHQAILAYLLQMAAQDNETLGDVKTRWYKGMLTLSTSDLETDITDALAVARGSGQPDLIVQSLDALASVKMQKGAWEECEQLVTEAYACYITLGDRAMEADALCMLANAHLHRGRLQLGITRARSALTISQEIRNAWGQVNALYDLTSGLLDSGAYTEALEIALQAVASARTLTMHSPRANRLLLRALIQLGGVYRAMQAGSAAREIDLEALALGEAIASSSYTAVVSAALCADYALVGEWAEAQRYAQQAAVVAGDHGWLYAAIPHWSITETLLREGDAVRAWEHLNRLDAHQGDGQRDRVQYLRANAELAQWEGHQGQARSHLEEARVLAEEIGLCDERWQIQVALGDLDQSQGEQVLAGQAYAQAMSVVQELAEKIEDETLRTRFLAAPQVQYALAQAAR